MLHLPVDVVWFHALERIGVTESSDLIVRIGAMVGVFVACIVVSVFAYLWLEEPARNWIRKIDLKLPRFRKAQPA
jgi:peptidoglycan/LPS O-acetylase OafA/YrhL